MAVYDTRLAFVRLNEALARVNGFTVEQHLGHRLTDLLPGINGAESEAVMRQVLESGEPVLDTRSHGRTPATPRTTTPGRPRTSGWRTRPARCSGSARPSSTSPSGSARTPGPHGPRSVWPCSSTPPRPSAPRSTCGRPPASWPTRWSRGSPTSAASSRWRRWWPAATSSRPTRPPRTWCAGSPSPPTTPSTRPRPCRWTPSTSWRPIRRTRGR
ncbi:PAS domain-containing protein [Kitasatospora aburaviensis]